MRPVLIALLFASLSAPALAQDGFTQLPAGAGRAETVKVCAQCHSPELVANQRLDEPGWRQVVNQMANNGAQATDAEFEAIIKYLATAFPSQSGAAPAQGAASTSAPVLAQAGASTAALAQAGAGTAALAQAGAATAAPAMAQDEFKQLPEGPGRAETVKVCSQCHSPELVANQRLDEPGWRQVVNQMANNGAQGTDAEFETIIKYLATTFPPN